jgi:hypothetical protein
MNDIFDTLGYEHKAKYAIAMWMLEEKAGLSYKEARVYLMDHRETIDSLEQEFGVTRKAIFNLMRRADRKVESSGMTALEIIGEENMPDFMSIDPPDVSS